MLAAAKGRVLRVRDGVIVCTGKPNGILRTEAMYQNLVRSVDQSASSGEAGAAVEVEEFEEDDGTLERFLKKTIERVDRLYLYKVCRHMFRTSYTRLAEEG